MRLLIFLPLFLAAAPVSSDIAARLARWKAVEMPYDARGLDQRQREVIQKLVDASRLMESIYWQQSDPEGLALYRSTKDPNLRRLLAINGCRWDLIDDNKPFAASKPIPPGRNLYPEGLTRTDRSVCEGASRRKRGHLQPLYRVAMEREQAGCDSLSRGI